MNFKEFEQHICSQIHTPCTVKYGCIGIEYLVVLAFIDGEFRELGELIYRIWRETMYTKEDLIAFGKECEDFRLGLLPTKPVWCYKTVGPTESKLTFYPK